MDFWWLFIGSVLLAVGAGLIAFGRSREMTTIASTKEKASGIPAGKLWEDMAVVPNFIGALVIVVGSLAALLKAPNAPFPEFAICVFYLVGAVGVGMIMFGFCQRRKMIKRLEAKIQKQA